MPPLIYGPVSITTWYSSNRHHRYEQRQRGFLDSDDVIDTVSINVIGTYIVMEHLD